jgi:hypothetical protein
MPLSTVLARVVARTGVAIWRHRFAWLVGAVGVAAIGAFQVSSASPTVINGDCADTTMAALTTTNDDAAHAAYACLAPGSRATPEDAWIAGIRSSGTPRGQLNRIAETRTNDGGEIVFYTVESRGQALGYIVYLDAQGLVRRIE